MVVQDNCTIPYVQEVTDTPHDAGVIAQYLPPYSPDYNPIEECFSFYSFCFCTVTLYAFLRRVSLLSVPVLSTKTRVFAGYTANSAVNRDHNLLSC